MGSGASNLSDEQRSTITKQIRDKYEELTFEDKPNDEIQKVLTEEFDKYTKSLFEAQVSEAPKKLGISKEAIKSKLAAGSTKMSTGSTKSTKSTRTATRRKSFDTKKLLPTPENPVATPETTPPTSTDDSPAGGSTNQNQDVVDSWDSVSQQPFCKICQMAFKSIPFLERHVKYSDIHIKNVAATSGTPVDMAIEGNEATPPPSGFDSKASMKQPKQVEGEHYKLIYSGSKFFWRTQETVDFDIYYHIHPNVVEVVSYEIIKSREMSRMYLNYTAMMDIIAAAGVQMPDEDTQRSAITTFLLQRLQLKTPKEVNNVIIYVPLSGDSTALKSPLLEKPPLMLIPVPVVRRRRTNAEEIDATISSLKNDRQALAAATGALAKEV